MLSTGAPIKPPRGGEEMLDVLEQLSGAVAQSDDIAAIANLMLDLAIACTAAEKGSLLLLEERDQLRILAARGIDPQLREAYTVRLGEGIAGTVALQRLPVLVGDIDLDDRFRQWKRDRYQTRSFISCPILCRSTLLGVININDKADRAAFTPAEFTLIKAIANLAAIAIENASLMRSLRTKTAAFDAATRRLVEKEIAKTEFLTRLSHELRTPLNAVKGAVFYLQGRDEMGPAERKEFSAIIGNETAKLISVVENLLTSLTAEDRARTSRKELIDITALLRDVIASSALLGLSGQKITVEEEGVRAEEIVGDRVSLAQLLVNLLEGLAGYAQGNVITVRMKVCEAATILITLGRSLDEGELSRLFTAGEGGERLKLYLAKKAAEDLRWMLEARRTADGCEIELIIPQGARQTMEGLADVFLDHALGCIAELMAVDTCSVMLTDDLTGELFIRAARGLDKAATGAHSAVGEGLAGWVAREGKPLLISDIEHHPLFRAVSAARYTTPSLLSVPLKAGSKVIGVLNLNNKRSALPFAERDLYAASLLGDHIGAFLGELRCGGSSSRVARSVASFEDLLTALKRYHKRGAAIPDLMLRIMEQLGASEKEKMNACYAAMVYDLGLATLPDAVLRKEHPAPAELLSLKTHPHTTVDLLEGLETPIDVQQAILHHHEAYDGSGYPDGLRGDKIPIVSRALAVVDTFCAMTIGSPHRPTPVPDAAALKEIRDCSGTRYDPLIVDALESVFSMA